MNYVEKFMDGVQSFINVNSATFSGAVDIIVVPQEDGSLACTSWHVRFGKLQLLNTSEKKVCFGDRFTTCSHCIDGRKQDSKVGLV
jgi:phosphatidate phosphatase LPIN